ncbi:hypothetical protein SRM_p84058 (plasmid) [Salinibacter ruber M8]|uniref:Uncharacterized protein n=1 Tax=Salinibacter ruber (strain M8) TaxID=761659 RepID=D6CW35_SALRM|nr:hypothetical protein SRM_p84058 [Salinibacter ruber M8]
MTDTDFVTPLLYIYTDFVEPGHRFCHSLAPILSSLGTDSVTSSASNPMSFIGFALSVNE